MVAETHERLAPAAEAIRPRPAAEARARKQRLYSPLTVRILALNIPALGILLAGALFLGQYRDGLVQAKIDSLRIQGQMMAGALGEAATQPDTELDQTLARSLLARLAVSSETRARLFARDGILIADSREIGPGALQVQTKVLPPPVGAEGLRQRAVEWIDRLLQLSPTPVRLPPYTENLIESVTDYEEAATALAGETTDAVRVRPDGTVIVSVGLPVQRFKRVLGALMVSADGEDIEAQVRGVRIAILQVFGIALAVTVLLSVYLSGTIARPIRRLAAAAEGVGQRAGRRAAIPDFTGRNDEIGDLSGALRKMTGTLYDRLAALEAFAADVAHEIRNPLTSIRSAVETLERTRDPDRQTKLIAIVGDDVRRMNRLITDISDASRLGAEMARAEAKQVDLVALSETLIEIERTTAEESGHKVRFVVDADGAVVVMGVEDRLGQVVRNLIANAVSFSPPDGKVRVNLRRTGDSARVTVEDDGPGVPEEKREAVFERFFSLRPEGEKFGTHSGLGLSISRQIVEAHGGRIHVENRTGAEGRILGARFVVTLPAA